jgi:hypothetical protein
MNQKRKGGRWARLRRNASKRPGTPWPADDPLIRADGMREGCHEGPTAEQSLAMMINRLRIVTGQNFGYDPDAAAEENEKAIAAWEDWSENSGRIQFTSDAGLVAVLPRGEQSGK